MTWRKLPAWVGPVVQGCISCPRVETIAPMDMTIGVGFGSATVTKDADIVYQEPMQSDNGYQSPMLAEFEALAVADPDHDWQVELIAPLRDRTYQRHEVGKWVLVKSGRGFA